MAPLRVRLGQTVRVLRSAAGFSQESFAAQVRVHRTFMGSIERGKTNVSLETLERLARGLHMTAWELLRIAETSGAVEQESRGAVGPRRAGTPYAHRPKRDHGPGSGERKVAEERDR